MENALFSLFSLKVVYVDGSLSFLFFMSMNDIMHFRPYACVWGNCYSIVNQKVGRLAGEGGIMLSDNPGQTGEGGSENLDFGRTSFMDAPYQIFGGSSCLGRSAHSGIWHILVS